MRSATLLSRSILFVIVASAAIVHGRQPLCQGLETRHLFKIERSKNANIVQYDVQLAPDGKLYQKEPVIAYWIRVAEDGQERELTFFQRKWYYGFKTKYDVGSNSAIVEMMAGDAREITIYEVEGLYRGEIRISGRPAFIEKIFVTSIKSGFYRKVTSIELYGKDTKTGIDCYEKIKP